MTGKSGRAVHGRTSRRRRRVTGREPSTTAVTNQAAGVAVSAQVKKGNVIDVQSDENKRHILTSDWRKTFIMGGILLVALIVISLILRYNFTV